MKLSLLLFALLLTLQASAQLVIGTGGMKILAGTRLTVNELTLTPSTSLSLSTNSLQKTTTPASMTPQASISRVYQFSVAFPFSGTVAFPYQTSELNGNTEGKLKLAYAVTPGGAFFNNAASTINTTTKFISTTFTSQNLAQLTAASQNPDLSPTVEMPDAQFTAGSAHNFVVNVTELNGLTTTAGSVRVTITAPVGYSVSFNNTLTSIPVTGGTTTTVNNGQWSLLQNLDNRQLILQLSQSVAAGATSALGITITRTTANSGSTSNITVNINGDGTQTYDSNAANNIYARIISGL